MARCPHCKLAYPVPRVGARFCRKCKLRIARHDKFIHVTVRGKTMIEHRDCSRPDVYPA